MRTRDAVTVRADDIGLPAVLCDAQGRLVQVNRQARATLDRGAVPGKALHQLTVDEAAAERLEAVWAARAAAGRGWSHECQLLGNLGAALDMQLVAIPVLSARTEGASWLVIIQDLTGTVLHAKELEIYAQELSQLYRENRQTIQKLEDAARSREHFFSLVSHELKTPLTSQKAAIEMLNTRGLIPLEAADAHRLVASLTRSSSRLERLISDLLDVSVARSGGLSLRFEPVDMNDVIQSVVDEMRPVAREKRLVLRGPARRKSVVVRGDEVRLQQVVQNLLGNAVKASPSHSTIQVTCAANSTEARVSVTNPGHIDESLRATLFEPFRKSAARGYRTGAGLGLTVVDALVRAHGGTVDLGPSRAKVTFTFTVPLWTKAAHG